MTLEQQAVVFRSLATLVDAGVPLERALGDTARLAPSSATGVLTGVRRRVREGAGLAAALCDEKAAPAFIVGMIRAGERGSGLATALEQAARDLEWRAGLARDVRAALTYPLVLVGAGLAAVVLIVGFVLPRFATVLEDLGQTLPPATRALLLGGRIVEHGWWVALAGGVALVVAAAACLDSDGGRQRWHELLLVLPVVGPIRAALGSAVFGRQLGALLAVGVPMLPALDGARAAVTDRALAARLARARERVAEGAALGEALRETDAATAMAIRLIEVGERSGRLAQLLVRAGDTDAAAAARQLTRAVQLLEPALILSFGAGVAFVAAALLQAVYAVRPGVP